MRPEEAFKLHIQDQKRDKRLRLNRDREFKAEARKRRELRSQLLANKQVITDGRHSLASEFVAPPISVINTHTSSYRDLERKWKDTMLLSTIDKRGWDYKGYAGESVFPLALAEILLTWFGGESIFDPYCGFVNKGIVAASLSKRYTGIDIRKEMILRNRLLCPDVKWINGDGTAYIPEERYDTMIACPPYYDLEVYSDLEDDISTLPTYNDFLNRIRMGLSSQLNYIDGYAIFIVGDIRDDSGFYRGFPDDIVRLFRDEGWGLYNRIILYTLGSAHIRARRQFNATEKLPKAHQTILVFRRR